MMRGSYIELIINLLTFGGGIKPHKIENFMLDYSDKGDDYDHFRT